MKIIDISTSILYGVSESAKSCGNYQLLRITDIQDNCVDWSSVPFTDYDNSKANQYLLADGDILFARTGATVGKSYLVKTVPSNCIYASYLIRIKTSSEVLPEYLKLFFESGFYWQQITDGAVGVGQPNVNGTTLGQLRLPMPPKNEQIKIVIFVNSLLGFIDNIEASNSSLLDAIALSKSKILDLAMQGKLVPQDPADEPAADMLRRVNPKAEIIGDNPHYAELPSNWVVTTLESITEYYQPQPYIVKSTDYSENYTTPVLTAGKSFILGYTNETTGIFAKLPVIIFDDFTTDSHYVDFVFKVKSSAMKIISVYEPINVKFISHYMSITRLVGDTHKRYWISEYSKLPIALPPVNEQARIVAKIEELYNILDEIEASLQA